MCIATIINPVMTTGSVLPETLGFVAKGTIIITIIILLVVVVFGAIHMENVQVQVAWELIIDCGHPYQLLSLCGHGIKMQKAIDTSWTGHKESDSG